MAGVVLLRMRRLQEAIPYFTQAEKLGHHGASDAIWLCQGGPLSPIDEKQYIEDMYAEATQLAISKQPGKALLEFNRVLEMDSQHKQAWLNKGVLLEELGRIEEALTCVDRALEIDPDYAHGQFSRGTMLLNYFRNYREALDCFEKAQQLGFPRATQAIALCRQILEQKS